jgi:hypothetical protein
MDIVFSLQGVVFEWDMVMPLQPECKNSATLFSASLSHCASCSWSTLSEATEHESSQHGRQHVPKETV